jgi:hypothetical protein
MSERENLRQAGMYDLTVIDRYQTAMVYSIIQLHTQIISSRNTSGTSLWNILFYSIQQFSHLRRGSFVDHEFASCGNKD